MRLLITLSLLLSLLSGDDTALYKKGQKIFNTFCSQDGDKISCPKMPKSREEALNFYLHSSNKEDTSSKEMLYISVPKDAKCPVCGMFVYKYPKWSSKIVVNGKSYYFDGVKDMMKYYIFDGDFIYNRDDIDEMVVSDYYTLEPIPAKEALYLYDSNIYGPMGRELIPFKSEESAKRFKRDHGGREILKFNEITDTLVMALDG